MVEEKTCSVRVAAAFVSHVGSVHLVEDVKSNHHQWHVKVAFVKHLTLLIASVRIH